MDLGIKKMIHDAVTEALTVEITIERVRDPKTGQPLAVTERKTEKIFIPSLIAQMLPYYEGAVRGLQQDLSRVKNSLDIANDIFKRLTDAVERQRLSVQTEVDMIEADDAGDD